MRDLLPCSGGRLRPRFEARILSTMVVQVGTEQIYRAVRDRDAQVSPPMTLPVPPQAADLASPDDHRPEAVACSGTGRWTNPGHCRTYH